MRLTVILLLAACIQVSAKDGSAQITLSEHNTPFAKVIEKIKTQSGYDFVSTYETLKEAGDVTVNVRKVTLQRALDECLKNKPLSYLIINKTVIIKPSDTKSNDKSIAAVLPGVISKVVLGEIRSTSAVNIDIPRLTPPPIEIKGRITDGSGNPLAGVSVTLKGSATVGTTTNGSGEYTISIENGNSILIFSSVGYIAQEVPVNGRTNIDIVMGTSTSSLQDVVVVGYGTQRRGDLTGAISSVSSKTLEGQPVSNVNEALQGRVPGVEFTAASGEPGAPLQIRIRGMGTFGNTGPLYIVDGVPIDVSDISSIDPNDIASVSILKDASAAAIYGSRAANGVVLITTKIGKIGSPQVVYNGYYGLQSFTNFIPMLNSQQYADLNNDASVAANKAPEAAFNNPENLKTNTDWQRAAFKTAPIQDHSLTVSGGSENAKYSVSAGYFNQQGVMVFNYLERYSTRVNSQFTIGNKKKLIIGENINLSRNLGLNQGQGNNLDFSYLLGASPTMPIYNPEHLGGYAGPSAATTGRNNRDNIIMRRDLMRNYENRNRIIGNVFADYAIVPSLKYHLNLGLNNGTYSRKLYTPIIEADNRSISIQSLNRNENDSYQYLVENTLTFDKVFHENYAVNLLAGFTQQNSISNSLGVSIQQFPSNELQVVNAGTGSFTVSGNEAEWALRSFLGRVNLKFFNKYLFTATMRRDGSSRFGSTNRYGNFPSLAAGWDMNREEFMENISFINSLKLRASWGKLGNQEIGNYANQSTINTSVRYILGTSQAVAPGAAITSLGNPNIKWESTEQTNVGVDMVLFENHLTFTADYWVKNTSGVLLRMPISYATGIDRTLGPYKNAAGIKNSGFEFALQYENKFNKLNYTFSGNLSTVKNLVTSLGDVPYILNQVNNAYNYGVFTYTTVGQSMSSFYGYIADGIFQNQSEIDRHAEQVGAAPGDIRFKDLNGDGFITAEDRTVIGDPFPDFSYGFVMTASFNNLDLYISSRGVQGKQLYNSQRAYLESMDGEHEQMATTLTRWHGEGTSNSMPRAVRGNPNDNTRPSTRFVENASFFKLQSVQIGYTLSKNITNKLKVKSVRAYLSGTNLLTVTPYKNFNPDILGGAGYNNVNNLDPLSIGVDTGTYPLPKVFQLGLQVNF